MPRSRRHALLTLAFGAIAPLVAASACAQAESLGGALEAFSAGQSIADKALVPGAGAALLADPRLVGGADGSTTIRGIPMSSDAAERLNRVLGGAVPGSPLIGQGPTIFEAGQGGNALLGQPTGGGAVSVPGITPSRGNAGTVGGASNVFTLVPGAALPGIP
jgi:hypothetical protein